MKTNYRHSVTQMQLVNRAEVPNVVRLAEFLQRNMCPDDLADLVEEFKKANSPKGDDYGVLLEICAQKTAREILTSYFSKGRLRRVLNTISTEKNWDSLNMDELVEEGLSLLGFQNSSSNGISCHSVLKNFRSLLGHWSESKPLDMFREVTFKIDCLMEQILEFYGTTLLGSTYLEVLMGKYCTQQKLKSRCFGDQVWLLKELCKKIRNDEAVKALYLEQFGRGELVETSALKFLDDLPKIRNVFIHANPKKEGSLTNLSISEQNELATEFVRTFCKFLEYLIENDIAPVLLVVDKKIQDREGKEYYDCLDHKGHSRRIFSVQNLEPGREYLVHSRINPLYMYPNLLAA